MEISWKLLEKNVKTLASFKWNLEAVNETINGVKFDCVLKIKNDHWIIVEITENESLNKVRDDLGKFSSIRQFLFSQNIYSECFMVMKNEPTESMVTTANGNNVRLLSYNSFSKLFIDFDQYFFIRTKKNFGSAVNPFSGEPDKVDYTQVFYENYLNKNELKLSQIVKFLNEGKRVVLLGNYGTGKSRCMRELFANLSNYASTRISYPIAINLKDNWGTQRAEEIVRRHFEDLGLSKTADSIVKILDSDRLIFMLDGFDEMAAQSWSDDSNKLKQIRASSLQGVKDLISKTKGPIIISGREHYFNTNKEMFSLLGLDANNTVLIKCKEEFSEEEMEQYLKNISSAIDIPFWLPRRPLICQIIASLDKKELETFFIDSDNAVEFWNTLLKNICDREARIRPVLDMETIKKILVQIAKMTRSKHGDIGPISTNEINHAFEVVVGTPPVDESSLMLQRLPGLGRISADSQDRQFIDYYILDGLRAESIIDIVNNNKEEVLTENWVNPIKRLGVEILSKKIQLDHDANFYIEFLKKASASNNKTLAGDLLTALVSSSTSKLLDLNGLLIHDANISMLNFSKSIIDNFTLKECIIEELDISNCSFSKISFKDCVIKKIYGISSRNELPDYLKSSVIEKYEAESLNSKDVKYNLSSPQMVLVSLIKKVFLLSGGAKLESELIEGFGNKPNKFYATEIIKIFARDKIISKTSVKKDFKCEPKTFHRDRMKKILKDLNRSKDSLWMEASKLSFTNKEQ